MRKVLDGVFVGKNEIEITGEKLTEMFMNYYWNIIRLRIFLRRVAVGFRTTSSASSPREDTESSIRTRARERTKKRIIRRTEKSKD